MSEVSETTRKASTDDTYDSNTQGPVSEDPGPPYDPPDDGTTEG